ncbi:hypothetical protein [Conchiformibius steedae]|uniref:hypothetical protein n=1 Tax=Conchiformibius steedae TaxID=153493 RepID=UPI0026ED4845|nr:hypothetical protein [Conchiformibius steedae]
MPRKPNNTRKPNNKDIQRSNEWLKKNRVTLVSNVRPETRAAFDAVHDELAAQGKIKSREDTVVYLCTAYREQNKMMNLNVLDAEDIPNLLNGAVYADKAAALAVVAYLETHYGIYHTENPAEPPARVRVGLKDRADGLVCLSFEYL